ncbi:hemerythrin domain-containing protein [Parendozoicomonas sp. Alg238-R29]|uniref:hemerythrin domain-containing protein n=1 Tax=Parendozoicomonas sp. Alg238-R29 TaxID=2993446 RepID=UPI00248F0E8E|nr:hemerythrin domain-containing protein [Parendozoicomonas sp. Alg238-R29]
MMKCANNNYFDGVSIEPMGFVSVYPGFSGYDERLTDVLTKEHTKLLANYIELSLGIQRRAADVQVQLDQFLTELENHFVLEDSKLYPQLIKGLTECPFSQTIISSISVRMHETSQRISSFVQAAKTKGLDHKDNHFAARFSSIGQTLRERIELEENVLYPIYRDLAN